VCSTFEVCLSEKEVFFLKKTECPLYSFICETERQQKDNNKLMNDGQYSNVNKRPRRSERSKRKRTTIVKMTQKISKK